MLWVSSFHTKSSTENQFGGENKQVQFVWLFLADISRVNSIILVWGLPASKSMYYETQWGREGSVILSTMTHLYRCVITTYNNVGGIQDV